MPPLGQTVLTTEALYHVHASLKKSENKSRTMGRGEHHLVIPGFCAGLSLLSGVFVSNFILRISNYMLT